jgi:molybdate/tungstate transport system substrate-binding protein
LKRTVILIFLAACSFAGCLSRTDKRTGEIIIFHAGSLSVPFKEIADIYQEKNPGIMVLSEPAGSLVCARKVTELKRPCDIVASADYFVIDELLIPEYASWAVRFSTNELVIAYQPKAKHSDEISSENWYEILMRDDVIFGRSDPDADPCGYRTVMLFKLAEKYYRVNGLADKMTAKNRDFIRPKEVDLIALVESNAIDYMFQYKSVAIQHGLNYIALPSEINLGNPNNNTLYSSVSLEVTGSSPGSRMTVRGEYINYSLTVLKDAPNEEAAIDFVSFLLSPAGMEILRKNGQDPLTPLISEQPDLVPEKLRKYLVTGQKGNTTDDKE